MVRHHLASKDSFAKLPYACESLSKAVIAQIGHNNPCGGPHRPDYLKRDTGGWTNMRTLIQFFTRHKLSCMGPVDDYVREYGAQFATMNDAKEAAFITLLSGAEGSRMSFLVAATEVVVPLSSASGHAGAGGHFNEDISEANRYQSERRTVFGSTAVSAGEQMEPPSHRKASQ